MEENYITELDFGKKKTNFVVEREKSDGRIGNFPKSKNKKRPNWILTKKF